MIILSNNGQVTSRDKVHAFLTNIAYWFLQPWFFMLAVGVIHAEWWPAVPTIGYWWAWVILWLLNNSFGRYTRLKSMMNRQAGAYKSRN